MGRPGGGLEAVKQTPDLSCVFTLVGKSGIVHNDATVAFRSAAGYINAAAGAQRAQMRATQTCRGASRVANLAMKVVRRLRSRHHASRACRAAPPHTRHQCSDAYRL